MIAGHLSKRTWLHRAPAGAKLIALAVLTVGFFAVERPAYLLAGLGATLLVYAALGREALARLALLRALMPIFAILGALQFVASGAEQAVATVARMALMILLADLVAMTTPMLAMMDALAPLFAPFRRFGVDGQRIALAFALVIRFVPVLLEDWRRRDEAWRARTGARRASFRLLAPWVASLPALADRVAESLDARGMGRR
ncbi:MAG: cobalt transport protein [Hyphomicrobiales bacterium]|nr:cobalt transport protein [Hyphomicrobiales bacterium]